jgi:hypothetical protein
MTITWSDVLSHAPELSTVSAQAQTDILAYVNSQLNTSVFGGEESASLRIARVMLAAHLATIERRQNRGQVGAVTSEALGPQNRSYGGAVAEAGMLGTTGYGQVYLMMVNSSQARGPRIL